MAFKWILIIFSCCQLGSYSFKKKIFIGCLVPSFSEDRYGHETALSLATEMINSRTDILKDYEIAVRFGDTFGKPFLTVRRVFEFLQWPKNESIQMIIGPAWTNNAAPSATACHSWNIVQLSYAAAGTLNYPLQFTNVPDISSFNKARLSIIKHFGWKRIAILQEYDDELYSLAVDDLKSEIIAKKIDLTLIAVEGFSLGAEGHPRMQLERLQKLDARIIIGEFSSEGATKVFCEAYKIGMFGQKYVWLLSFMVGDSWIFQLKNFKKFYNRMDCNVTLIAEASEGFIMIDRIPIRQDSHATISGLTASEFMRETLLRNHRTRTFTSYTFDAMWAVALTLNKSLSEESKYHPGNTAFGDLLVSFLYVKLLLQTKFEGLSGPHRFAIGKRQGIVQIRQMRMTLNRAKLVQVGRYNTFEGELILEESEIKKLWKGGKIPVDVTTKEKKILIYSLPQLVTVGIFSTLGIFYSLAFLHFNVSKRNHKVVRLSSPMLNNIILLGCFFCYVYILFLGIDSRFVDDSVFGVLCNVRLYVLTTGFSLSFGALFSKTWRVHKIFTAQTAIKKKMMRDVHLIVFVLFLVLIDVVFVTIWVYFDRLQTEDIIFDKKKENSDDLIIIPVLKICECTHRMKFLGALYAYKGILLLFGVFLAWETRDVTIPALNDSKYIGISVYNVVILSAIGASVSMVLKKTVHFELLYVLVSLVVLLSTTVTLTLMLLPKVYEYYCSSAEPEERVRTMETLHISTQSATTEADDIYEVFVKRDVKDKWIQTEHVNHVHNSMQGPTVFQQEEKKSPGHGDTPMSVKDSVLHEQQRTVVSSETYKDNRTLRQTEEGPSENNEIFQDNGELSSFHRNIGSRKDSRELSGPVIDSVTT